MVYQGVLFSKNKTQSLGCAVPLDTAMNNVGISFELVILVQQVQTTKSVRAVCVNLRSL